MERRNREAGLFLAGVSLGVMAKVGHDWVKGKGGYLKVSANAISSVKNWVNGKKKVEDKQPSNEEGENNKEEK